MDTEKNAREIRSKILAVYYSQIYQNYLFQKDVSSCKNCQELKPIVNLISID